MHLASVQGILGLCAGLPFALAVTGGLVASQVSLGYPFDCVCDRYWKDLEEKTNWGATILEGAINLSLKHLNHEWRTVPELSSNYSMYQMYISLSVLEKQEWMPVSVLAEMWGVHDKSAKQIAELFSSVCLGKTAVQRNDAEDEQVCLSIHDLHYDFCRNQAQGENGRREWHFRLLKGHMASLSRSTCTVVDFGSDLQDILKHSSLKWHQEDLKNRSYILQNLTRHLFEAGLVSELWCVVLDPGWIHAQMKECGISPVKCDRSIIEMSLRNCKRSEHTSDVLKAVRIISRSVEAMPLTDFENIQTLSFSLLSRICQVCRQEPFLLYMRDKIVSVTPKPCIVPVHSYFAPASEGMEAELNLLTSFTSSTVVRSVDYSPCGRYLVASICADVIVLDAETRECVNRSTFHELDITVVKFASSSKIISASHDNTVAVWNWTSSQTPVVLRDHTDIVCNVALSTDNTKLISASEDCTVKISIWPEGGQLNLFLRGPEFGICLCKEIPWQVLRMTASFM